MYKKVRYFKESNVKNPTEKSCQFTNDEDIKISRSALLDETNCHLFKEILNLKKESNCAIEVIGNEQNVKHTTNKISFRTNRCLDLYIKGILRFGIFSSQVLKHEF